MSFYFEPLNRYLSKSGVRAALGSQVLEWNTSRQQEIGLFEAVIPTYEYNKYSDTVGGITWTKYADEATFQAANPSIADQTAGTYPAYFAVRAVTPLSGAALTNATANAKQVVSNEVEGRLSDAYAWDSAGYGGQAIQTYINELKDLYQHAEYPAGLAYQVDEQTYTDWPSKPAVDMTAGPVATKTNADVAFERIILSYSVPGSYPEKVTAMDNAVATYTVNGDVDDLYNAAVTELNNLP